MENIFKHVENLRNTSRILVVGDLILDEYIWGKVERISPEAPVQIIEQQRSSFSLGGAANVANNLATLGCKVDMIGVIGDDDAGRKIKELLSASGIGADSVIAISGRPTTNKTRVIAHNQQIIRIDREDKSPLPAQFENIILAEFNNLIAQADGIIISDYLKGVVTENVAHQIILSARSSGKLVIADPKGKDLRKLRGASIITPNMKEIAETSPFPIRNEEDVEKAVKHLFEQLHLQHILLTRSEKGMSLFHKNGEKVDIPTTAKDVFDVTGAGDTVVSVLTMALVTGLDMVDACKLANRAAGIAVGKVGVSTITLDEIIDELKENLNHSVRKIVDLQTAGRVAGFLRNNGKRIVFTNGCFDLLHYGHIKYLQDARNLGNILIVGLNSDESVRRLKGDKRPLINEKERANLLAAMNCIDYIVVFSEDTPIELIKAIKPDVLVKGGDYSPNQVVGKEEVEATGGSVQIIPLVEGLSTSNIVQKIVATYNT